MTSPAFKQIKMAPLTVEDRLLIKRLRIEKGWTLNRVIVDFPLILETRLGANFVYIRDFP